MPTTFELTQQYASLLHLAEEEGADPESFNQALESIGGEIADKVDGMCMVMQELIDTHADRNEQAKRLRQRATHAFNAAARIREYLHHNLNQSNISRVEGKTFTVSVQASGGVREMQIDEDKVPDEFQSETTDTIINREEIRDLLESGEEFSFARLMPRKTHLRIR